MLNPFYFDQTNQRRKNAIYAPILDRFILVDDQDISVTFDTANAISSKIATVVFMIPRETAGMTNQNCLEYAIFNKAGFTKEGSSTLIRGQNPSVRLLNSSKQIVNHGLPTNGFENGFDEKLIELKQWTEYVHKMMSVINILRLIGLDGDTATFSDSFLEEEITSEFRMKYDASNVDDGIINSMKRVLYNTDNVQDAEQQMKAVIDSNTNVPVRRMVSYVIGEFFNGT